MDRDLRRYMKQKQDYDSRHNLLESKQTRESEEIYIRTSALVEPNEIAELPYFFSWYQSSHGSQIALIDEKGRGKTYTAGNVVWWLTRQVQIEPASTRPIVCFRFYHRNHNMPDNAADLYSQLMLQLLDQHESIWADFESQLRNYSTLKLDCEWLRLLLLEMINKANRPVYIIIDDVDGYDQISQSDIALFCKSLSEAKTAIKFLWTSRYSLLLENVWSSCERVHWTANIPRNRRIIKSMIHTSLRDDIKPNVREKLFEKLWSEYRGSLEWVREVLDLVEAKSLRDFRSINRAINMLDSKPSLWNRVIFKLRLTD